MSQWWLPLGVVVGGEGWLPQTAKVYSAQIYCKWQTFRAVICEYHASFTHVRPMVGVSVSGWKIQYVSVSVWSFLTCISGLATSSTMFLHSSLESAAIASSLSCTSWPLIWKWHKHDYHTCKQTQAHGYTHWGQLHPLNTKALKINKVPQSKWHCTIMPFFPGEVVNTMCCSLIWNRTQQWLWMGQWPWADGAVVFTKVSGSVHTSSRTINWPLTGGVHLFAGRVMALSLVDNSARVLVCLTNTHTPSPGLNQSHSTW